ncbi:hypothetical protein INR49_002254 [Caranx melampygus]|nr:hypothetical protein INR49_002254 [Caranx melampygus]
MMTKMSLWLLLLGLAVTSAAAAGPGSCVARCGEAFTRGQWCKCDFSCLQHNECCPDFEAACTTTQSCQGRCGEQFRRGQLCECDPQCARHNTCCPDYQLHCDASVSSSHPGTLQPLRAAAAAAPAAANKKSKKSKKKSNSESEEQLPVSDVGGSRSRSSTLQDVAQSTVVAPGGSGGPGAARGPCPQFPGGQCPGPLGPLNPRTAGSSGPTPPATPTHPLQYGVSDGSAGLLPLVIPGSPDSQGPAPVLPSYSGLWQGSGAPVNPSGHGAAGGRVNEPLVLSPQRAAPYGSSQGSRFQPQNQQDLAQGLGPLMVNGGSQAPGAGLLIDIRLCSDSPINGLTALGNGTILIFKGELFWPVDPVSREAGQPQSITDALGVPSPVDTVFTRWSCNGKANIYIIKGDQLWSLDENLAVVPGYPKPLASEFPGLTGPIIAVLVVPATGSQPETLYFFKSGDIMQRFTSPPGSAQSCSSKPMRLKTRLTRQAGLLSGEINIKLSLKGFPSPVTSALTMPNPQMNDEFFHFVFSGPIFFRVQIVGDLPALAKPDPSAPLAPLPIFSPDAPAANPANMPPQSADPAPPVNSIRVWLGCP